MPLFDLNKILKGAQNSAENLKKTVADVAKKLPENIREANVGDYVKDLTQKGQEAFDTIREKGEKVIKGAARKEESLRDKASSTLRQEENHEKMISFQDAFRIIYALIAVDGQIRKDEEEKLDEIGKALDPGYISCESAIGTDMEMFRMLPTEDPEELYDTIHNYVGNIILKSQNPKDGIRSKTLLWDLMTVSYSDNEKSEAERRLIRYIANSLGEDQTVCREMDQTIQTLLAIEKETDWLKRTNRPYLEIEGRINELSDRKNAIMNGIQALLAD